jgi:hypothetical protein
MRHILLFITWLPFYLYIATTNAESLRGSILLPICGFIAVIGLTIHALYFWYERNK